MRRCLLLLAVLLVAADPAPEQAARKERARLQGVWVMVVPDFVSPQEFLRGGVTVFEITPEKIKISLLVLDEDKIINKPGGAMTFTLDPSRDPKAIDFTPDGDADKGKVRLGIYRLSGDELTVAVPRDGARPTTFTSDRTTVVMVFHRTTPDGIKKLAATLEEIIRKNLDEARVGMLPPSRMARPVDSQVKDPIVVGIDSVGDFTVAGRREPFLSVAELRGFLKEQRRVKPAQTTIVLRAHEDATVASLHQAAQAARAEGFRRLFVQVRRGESGEGWIEFFVADWHHPTADVAVLAHKSFQEDRVLGPIDVKVSRKPTPTDTLELLETYLRAQRKEEEVFDKDRVCVRAAGGLKIVVLIGVLDSCLASGFSKVTLGPLLNEEAVKHAKSPAPTVADQARAEKEIKAIYEARYAKPVSLWRRLRESAEICDDPAARFVFLREAADAAARAGQFTESMEALDQLGGEFTIDIGPLKVEKFRNAPANAGVVDAALREASNFALQNRRNYAARFLRIAQLTAKQAKDPGLVSYVEERRELLDLPKVDTLDPFPPPSPQQRPDDKQITPAGSERAAAPQDSMANSIVWYGIPAVLAALILGGGFIWWLRRSRPAQARGGQLALPDTDSSEAVPPQG
jgi:uncharacterized protein (TIGR03067 family)